ncbi:MAG: hypothetical protein AAF823_14065 [Planctomycetota bacterium]
MPDDTAPKSKNPNELEPGPFLRKSLDDMLVALQMSFSRVSHRTQAQKDRDQEAALAMITGPVAFNMTLNVRPDGDLLVYDEKGGMQMTVSGTITPDIRYSTQVGTADSDAKAPDASDTPKKKTKKKPSSKRVKRPKQ